MEFSFESVEYSCFFGFNFDLSIFKGSAFLLLLLLVKND